MPIGLAAGAAAATVGAAAIGAGATKKASKTAATQAAADRALQEKTYNQNTANLTPFMARGNAAGNQINALLGLGGYEAPPSTAGALSAYSSPDLTQGGLFSQLIPGFPGFQQGVPQQQVQQAAPQQSKTAAQAANEAYETFKQSTGYQTRLNEGYRGINSAYAAKGTLQSGAALKSALRYGQDYASNEFGNYLGYLGNQQGVGLSGASALAGVGQNYANNVSAIGQNSANLQAQATIAGARNTQGAITGLAGIAGQTVGALSSYNPSVYQRLDPGVQNTIAQNPAIF